MVEVTPWISRALSVVVLGAIVQSAVVFDPDTFNSCFASTSKAEYIHVTAPKNDLPTVLAKALDNGAWIVDSFLCNVTPVFMDAIYGPNPWSARMLEVLGQLFLGYNIMCGVEAIRPGKKAWIVLLVPLYMTMVQTLTIAFSSAFFWWPGLWASPNASLPSLNKIYALTTTTFFVLVPGIAGLTVLQPRFGLEAVTAFQFVPIIAPLLYLIPGLDHIVSLPARFVAPKHTTPHQALARLYTLSIGMLWLLHMFHIVTWLQSLIAAKIDNEILPPMSSIFTYSTPQEFGTYILGLDFAILWAGTFLAIIRDHFVQNKSASTLPMTLVKYLGRAALLGPGAMLLSWRLDLLERHTGGHKLKTT